MLDRPQGPMRGEQVELLGEQGLGKVKIKAVKIKAVVFVGTKETKGRG